MQGTEVYADLVAGLNEKMRRRVGKLSPEALAWQPDAEGNSVGVTVWHVARWLDVIARIFNQKPQSEELWLTQGWAARTGYNPQGIGSLGLGALTGYTQEEVGAIPQLNAEELLTYLDQSSEALRAYLLSLPSFDALLEPVPGWVQPEPTKHQLFKDVLIGCLGHVGEIEALTAMMRRAQAAHAAASANANKVG
ncbi:MAG TPA: DinB family protein [Ktedonobacterales bacterium]|nr:DinB family protein [Ktedonobacterales bacterium]